MKSEELDTCYLCLRIPRQKIEDYARNIWQIEIANQIINETISLMKRVYQENPTYFCAKRACRILSGFFYILGIKHEVHVTQRKLAEVFETTEMTVHNSIKLIEALDLPELHVTSERRVSLSFGPGRS